MALQKECDAIPKGTVTSKTKSLKETTKMDEEKDEEDDDKGF
jgi:hypothetical protein